MKEFKQIACLLAFLAFSPAAISKCNDVIKIAVIDTGFGYPTSLGPVLGDTSHLCKYGHKDFTKRQKYLEDAGTIDKVPTDTNMHGTNIAGVIEKELKGVQYCLVILKYYEEQDNEENAARTIKAINYAAAIKADFINYSGGGYAFLQKEQDAVLNYLNGGGIFMASAGNGFGSGGVSIDISPFYPAMDDIRVIVVGANGTNKEKLFMSNFGERINLWEVGENVEGNGITLSGTSQATATATGKMVAAYDKDCKTSNDKYIFFKSLDTQENSCH